MTNGTKLQYKSGPLLSASDLIENRRAQEQARGSLSHVRTVAEKWRNGSAIAAAIAGGASFVAAPGAVDAIADWARWVVLGLALVGTVFGLMSIVLSMLASFGWPRRLTLKSPLDLVLWEQNQADIGIRQLHHARWTGIVAVTALVAAVLVVTFAPDSTAKLRIELRNGTSLCVNTLTVGRRTFDAQDQGSRVAIDMSYVASISSGSDC